MENRIAPQQGRTNMAGGINSTNSSAKRKQSIFFTEDTEKRLSEDERELARNLSKEEKVDIEDGEVETVIRSLINRMRFNYSLYDMVHYHLKCVRCRKKRTMKMRDDLTKHYKF